MMNPNAKRHYESLRKRFAKAVQEEFGPAPMTPDAADVLVACAGQMLVSMLRMMEDDSASATWDDFRLRVNAFLAKGKVEKTLQ